MIIYSLHMTFNLLVLPEFVPFSHTTYLEANLVDVGMYYVQTWLMASVILKLTFFFASCL